MATESGPLDVASEQHPAFDRALGALLGLATGDALGTTLEFEARDVHARHTEMTGGGPFGLAPGQWTDDTSMALCLADSIARHDRIDPGDLMTRFVDWWRNGANSSTGSCFDIGNTTVAALLRFEATGEALAGSTAALSAGNGALMRLAPVAIRWHSDAAEASRCAALQGRTTHGAQESVDACEYFAMLLVEAIAGASKEDVLRPRDWSGEAAIARIAAGEWRGKARHEIESTGYVVHTLEAALWCVARADTFEDALVEAVNLAGDADTVGAVTGQLAGALWGGSAIPERWLEPLAWRQDMARRAAELYRRGSGG